MLINSIPVVKWLFRGAHENGSALSPAQGDKELLEICALAPEAALAKLGVTDKGLNAAQVEERRAKAGLNEVARRKRLGFVAEILQRFKNPLVIQLMVIAGVSYSMGYVRPAVVVALMLLLCVFLGYFPE